MELPTPLPARGNCHAHQTDSRKAHLAQPEESTMRRQVGHVDEASAA
jgi:hypothetical protein